MKFHSHQLRDAFVVTHLLNGTSMEDLSRAKNSRKHSLAAVPCPRDEDWAVYV
jgi:hypothetical protein